MKLTVQSQAEHGRILESLCFELVDEVVIGEVVAFEPTNLQRVVLIRQALDILVVRCDVFECSN